MSEVELRGGKKKVGATACSRHLTVYRFLSEMFTFPSVGEIQSEEGNLNWSSRLSEGGVPLQTK